VQKYCRKSSTLWPSLRTSQTTDRQKWRTDLRRHKANASQGIFKEFLELHNPSPFPLPSFPLPFLPIPSLPFPSPPLPPLRSWSPCIQLGGLGERCKLPQRGLGRCPSRNRIGCILALKFDIWRPKNLTIFQRINRPNFTHSKQYPGKSCSKFSTTWMSRPWD